MKVTKYEHACFSVEHEGKLLIVDPGGWTTDLPALENVVAVVITHEHPDHYDVAALGAIKAHNPDVVIYAHSTITRQFGDTLTAQPVEAGQSISAGPFSVSFFGGDHAVIHPSAPIVTNLAVMINGKLYYPGDSFYDPKQPIEWLALPVTAPWLKIEEAIDFVKQVQPAHVFPTHDAIASQNGKQLVDSMIPAMTGVDYNRLSEPIEIN